MADLETRWAALASAALVGTARRPDPVSLGLPVEPRASAEPPVALLDQLALAATWRTAGARPTSAATPPPAPEEVLPTAPERALQLLDIVLTQPPGGPGARPGLLERWAVECRAAGVRVAHRHLVPLLDLAASRPGLRSSVVPVLGERGRWLAQQSAAWVDLVGPPELGEAADTAQATEPADPTEPSELLPPDWRLRPVADQVDLLIAARRRDPDVARAAVAELLDQASAKERAQLLEVLAVDPLPADADLLEQVLDDRAASVRAVATRILDGLPTSARALRMAARLRPLIDVQRKALRRTVVVELPDDPGPDGVRDGLGPAPRGVSVRALHLTEIIAGAPLSTWGEATGWSPADVVRHLRVDSEVWAGLRRAAAAQRDPDWADALLDDARCPLDGELVELVPESRAARLVLTRLRSVPPDERFALLARLPGPWSAELTAAAVGELRRNGINAFRLAHGLDLLGDRFDPGALPVLHDWHRSVADEQVRKRLGQILSTMTFRQSISEAFR